MLFYTHEDCLKHEMQPGHPERPDRLRAILERMGSSGLLDDLNCRVAKPAAIDDLGQVHVDGFAARLRASAPESGLATLDADTVMNPHSLDAALLASGAVQAAVKEVLDGPEVRAFCAVRPPGHHAEADAAMGFCFFNSIALGASVALEHVDRVAILDFDVHHGNGTVDIFKDRPEVLVCSSFQHPFYPNRYQDIERPNIINTPLPAGTDSQAFRTAVERDWSRAIADFQPQLILVSAGFDAHRDDPLGELLLGDEDYRWITELIIGFADDYSEGRIVSALEGGYDLAALARSTELHVATLNE